MHIPYACISTRDRVLVQLFFSAVKNNGVIFHTADWGLAEFYHPGREYNVRVASRYFKGLCFFF